MIHTGCEEPEPFDGGDGIADYTIGYTRIASTPYRIDTTVTGFYSRYITDVSEVKMDVYVELLIPTETNKDRTIDTNLYVVETSYKNFKHTFRFTIKQGMFGRGEDKEAFEKYFKGANKRN